MIISSFVLTANSVNAQEDREYKIISEKSKFAGIRGSTTVIKEENFAQTLNFEEKGYNETGIKESFIPQNNRIYSMSWNYYILDRIQYNPTRFKSEGPSFSVSAFGGELGMYDEIESSVLNYDFFVGGCSWKPAQAFVNYGNGPGWYSPPFSAVIYIEKDGVIINGNGNSIQPYTYGIPSSSTIRYWYQMNGLSYFRFKGSIDISGYAGELKITVVSLSSYKTLKFPYDPVNPYKYEDVAKFTPNFDLIVKDISTTTNVSAPKGFMGIKEGEVSVALNKYSTENQFILADPGGGTSPTEENAWFNLNPVVGYESIDLSSNGKYDDFITYNTYPVMFHSMFEYKKNPDTGKIISSGVLSAKVKIPYMLESDVKKKFALSIEFFAKATETENVPLPNEVGGGEGPFFLMFSNHSISEGEGFFFTKNILVEKYIDKNKDTWLRFRGYYDFTREFGTVINPNENDFIYLGMMWGVKDGTKVFFSDLSVEYDYDNYLENDDRKTVVDIVSQKKYDTVEDKIAAEKEAMYQTDSGKEVIDATNKQIEENRRNEILKYVYIIITVIAVSASVLTAYFLVKKRRVSKKPGL